MTPEERAIWAAAYGAAFAAEVRELEQASDAADPFIRTSHATDNADVERAIRIADAAIDRLQREAPRRHPVLVCDAPPPYDEPAPHSERV